MRLLRGALCCCALAIGCSPTPTTLLLTLDAAAGVTVQSVTLRVALPGGAEQTQTLPMSGATLTLPGRVLVKFADTSMDVTVAADGQTSGGEVVHAGAVVFVIAHTQVAATLTLGGAASQGDMGCLAGAARCVYTHRRALTIMNGAAAALPAGYTVRVPLDAALFPAASVRADLNDVRLFGDAGDGERDRVVDAAPPGQARALWFRLTKPIAAGASDGSYAVYYGNPGAGAPPADAAQVFALWDGFDSGTAPASPPWTANATPAVAGGNLTLHQNTEDAVRTTVAGDGVPTLSALEWRARITDAASAGQIVGTMGTFWYWAGYQRQDDFIPAAPWIVWIARAPGNDLHAERKIPGGVACNTECIGPTVAPDTSYHWYRVERDPMVTRFYRDGALSFSVTEPNDTDYSIMLRNYAVTSDLLVDWVRARALASPEPAVTVGAEELVQ